MSNNQDWQQSQWDNQSQQTSWDNQSWDNQSQQTSWNNQSWDQQPSPAAPQQSWDQSWNQQPVSSSSAQPYYGGGGYYAAPQQAESKGPGVIAVVLAGVALVISLILSVVGAMAMAELYRQLGTTDIDNVPLTPDQENSMAVVGLTTLGQLVPTVLGIVALVLAGRAMGKPGSKGMGVFALIVALVAPVISFIVFMAIVMPAVPAQ